MLWESPMARGWRHDLTFLVKLQGCAVRGMRQYVPWMADLWWSSSPQGRTSISLWCQALQQLVELALLDLCRYLSARYDSQTGSSPTR